MTIAQAKKLQRFDKFRRSSVHGDRIYTVTLAYPEGFTAIDQHGYHARFHWNDSSVKPALKTCELLAEKGHISYDEILDRDVPVIREHARSWARQGIVAPIEIFYRKEAIAGQSVATTHDMTDEGWKSAGVTIPANIPYDSYHSFLRERLTRIPLFA